MGLTESIGPPYEHATGNTTTTNSYTPLANTLQVVVLTFGNGNAIAATVTVTDSVSGTWKQLVRLAGSASPPYSDVSVWCKDAGASPLPRR